MANDLMTIADAARLLGVAIGTVTYYIREGQLNVTPGDRLTANRRQQRLLYRNEVYALKRRLERKQPAKDSNAQQQRSNQVANGAPLAVYSVA